uniref:NADH-ubiquinone oxidoreductase chain 6 n=1 Tax=Pselaphinae sp. 9 EF-2015 TaxID=1756863 RepID=A0A0S2M8Z6_9COLE|nr:NADH deshydrogenase subunit 6 [Pselaphinae sp. 9 EF-2015]
MFFMMLSLSMSMMFIFLTHPLTMGATLLIQTIIIALITGMLMINFWFSYILFLIMIGGMLVLFIYMTSIASNEKFMFSNKLMLFFLMMIMMSLIMFILIDNKFFYLLNFSSNLMNNYQFSLNLSKFFNFPSNIILFLMIIYLFITLIAVVKITNIKIGPLRQKF